MQEAKRASDEYTTRLIAAAYGSAEQSMELAVSASLLWRSAQGADVCAFCLVFEQEAEIEEEDEEVAALATSRSAEAKHDRKQQKGTPDAATEKAKKARKETA